MLKQKLKTKKSALKRIKIIKNTFIHARTNKSHFMRKKSVRRLARLTKTTTIHMCNFKKYKRFI